MANSEIRIGRVSSINYETGMARVTYRDKDETVTTEFPMLNFNDEYRMPKVGQDVMVAHLSNGSSRGVVMGTIWNRKYAPVETGAGLYRKDLSRKKDAAYVRYDDKSGEYLIKVANLHLNGVNETVLDGPKVEIAANLSILLQTDRMHADVPKWIMTGGESGETNIEIAANMNVRQEEGELQAVIMKAALEFLETLELKVGISASVEAGEGLDLKAGERAHLQGESVEISAKGRLKLEDGEYSTTLKEIMERLEALEGR